MTISQFRSQKYRRWSIRRKLTNLTADTSLAVCFYYFIRDFPTRCLQRSPEMSAVLALRVHYIQCDHKNVAFATFADCSDFDNICTKLTRNELYTLSTRMSFSIVRRHRPYEIFFLFFFLCLLLFSTMIGDCVKIQA